MSADANDRYNAACHAMQSGVAMEMQNDPSSTSPKHLRVGVNSAMVDSATIARLLIDRGIFTEAEFRSALADQMEVEKKLYEERLSKWHGVSIKLG
jgi:hypothetical protein